MTQLLMSRNFKISRTFGTHLAPVGGQWTKRAG